jgi:hypothetical protein
MKISINSKTEKEEFSIYDVHHYARVIAEKLLTRYENEDAAYDYLIKQYNSYNDYHKLQEYRYTTLSGNNPYMDFPCSDEKSNAKPYVDLVFDLVCHMSTHASGLLSSTIIYLANKHKGLEYLKLFILFSHTNSLTYNDCSFSSLICFFGEDKDYILELLLEANKAGLFKKSATVKDIILKKEIVDNTLNFIDCLKLTNGDNLDYISFSHPDYTIDNQEYLLREYYDEIIKNFDIKQIKKSILEGIKSSEFLDYTLKDLVIEFLDENDFCFFDFSINKIRQDTSGQFKITKGDIQQLKIKTQPIVI